MKQRKIWIPLLAAGMALLLVGGILGGYALGLAKGRTAAEEPEAQAEADRFLYVEEPRTYEGDAYAFPERHRINEEGWLEDCQIPGDVMKQLTTKQLFESSLRCPLHREQMLSSTLSSAGNWMAYFDASFNGMRELRQRKDLGAMLVSYFGEFTEEEFSTWGYSSKPLRAAEIAAYLVDRGDVDRDACLALREALEAHTEKGESLGCVRVLYDTLNSYLGGEGRSSALWEGISGVTLMN